MIKNINNSCLIENYFKEESSDDKIICNYCKKYLVLPYNEIETFISYHINLQKKSKYLILIFRLCPKLFSYESVIINKFLRDIFFKSVRITYDSTINVSNYLSNIYIQNLYQYYITREVTAFVYELYFYQQNIDYLDHIKCSICNNHICPLHIYLSNCYYSKCNYCNNNWFICGWCKSNFNELYICKLYHNKNK
jgi:hypothetical protein